VANDQSIVVFFLANQNTASRAPFISSAFQCLPPVPQVNRCYLVVTMAVDLEDMLNRAWKDDKTGL
jgi:hypothetical protein